MDVTKPIIFETADYKSTGWLMFNIDDNPYGMEYVDEHDRSTPSKIKIINYPRSASTVERTHIYKGFVSHGTVHEIAHYLNITNTNIYEFVIGETAAQSFYKINGSVVAGLGVKRSDFADGKAYFGLFSQNVSSFTVNTNMDAPAAVFNASDNPEAPYTLKGDSEIKIFLANVDRTAGAGDITLSCGDISLTGADFSLNDGVLILKSGFMRSLRYTNMLLFNLSYKGKATQIRIKAELPVPGADSARLAEGEQAKKTFNGTGDVTFGLDLRGDEVYGIVKTDDLRFIGGAGYTVANGLLTIKNAEILSWGGGEYKLLLETDKSFVAFYIISRNFSAGFAKNGGGGTVAAEDFGLRIDGDADCLIESSPDLAEGLSLTLEIDKAGGYYNHGTGGSQDCIEYRFNDLDTGISVIIVIRANAAADNGDARFKTWIDINVKDAEGNDLVFPVNIWSRSPTAGKHRLQFKADSGRFVVIFNNEPEMAVPVSLPNPSQMLFFISSSGFNSLIWNDALDYSALDTAFEAAGNVKKTSNYTSESYAVYESAYADADRVMICFSQQDIDSAADALLAAIGGLKEKGGCNSASGAAVIAVFGVIIMGMGIKRRLM